MKHETKIKALETIKDTLEHDGRWAAAALAQELIEDLGYDNQGLCVNSSCPNNHSYFSQHCIFNKEINECAEFYS